MWPLTCISMFRIELELKKKPVSWVHVMIDLRSPSHLSSIKAHSATCNSDQYMYKE